MSNDWREILADEDDADDEQLQQTPPDVTAVLGFDPADEDETEAVRTLTGQFRAAFAQHMGA